MRFAFALLGAVVVLFGSGVPLSGEEISEPKIPSRPELLQAAVGQLIKIQEDGGLWPYEGVHRVRGQIPIGYRVGGTAIVADTLLQAAPDNKEARTAIAKALSSVLKGLQDPTLA